ncbi:MAG: glycyl-radical enzyme activating protein, partial [Candidatus Hermodarchaeota archaeon]
QGLIFKIERMATDDGPGVRTTIFFNTCPLNCVWCHNPESIPKKPQLYWTERKCIACNSCIDACQEDVLIFEDDGLHINRERCTSCGECIEACPSTALSMYGKWWDVEELFHEIEKEKIFFDKAKGGITVSGGEPTLQPDFLLKILKLCKENGISTALDTCGISSKKVYQDLLPYLDIVLLDIKEIDPEKHKEFTGVSNKIILENAKWMSKYLKEKKKIMWIRTPLIPNYTATEENVQGIGEFIVKELENIPDKWDLLSFNKLCDIKYTQLDMSWSLKDEPLMTKEEMEHFVEIAYGTGVKNVKWSGLTRQML